MLKAMQLIEKNRLTFVVIETNNLYVATLRLEVSTEPSWQPCDLIMECRNILKRNTSTTISFARWVAGFVGHSIAQYSLSEEKHFEFGNSAGCLPIHIEDLINSDVCN